MREADVLALAAGLDGVQVLTASKEGGAPEVAWGDSFFYSVLPGEELDPRQQPFATLVCSDYPGFDEQSRLDRPGIFRVNLAVGRKRYQELIGSPAAEHDRHRDQYDYAEADVVIPHPVYAAQGWVAVVNPGTRTEQQVRELFTFARDLAAGRQTRRRSGAED